MSNHPEIQLQADDGTLQGNIYINGSGELVFREATNGNQLILNNDGTLKASGNLRIDAGQSIEDGSGTKRMLFSSGTTRIYDPDGSSSFDAQSGETQIVGRADSPITFVDGEGAFTALQYNTSANAPGTLELTNADLDASSQSITTSNFEVTENSTTNSLDFNYTG